ncbi:MAG: PepSY-associated TM helix domain-containing protein, partial [Bacteroidota bacterium]
HFASFGGLFMKIVYFILSMITCFMLLAGVLLWQAARNNNKYTPKQRQFHHRVTKVYLAICLSLFPATALLFIANKLIGIEMEGRAFYVNSIFFGSWFLLTLIGWRWNDFKQLNRNYLIIGGVASLSIPLANGIVTNDWIWTSFTEEDWYVFSVDITWLFTGATAFLIWWLSSKANTGRKKQPKVQESTVAKTNSEPRKSKPLALLTKWASR